MKSEQELIAELQKRFAGRKGWLLGVDGEQRVGKTTLATVLAKELHATKLSGDDFVRQGRLPYPKALALDELSDAVANVRASNGSVIVESVMLQLILEGIGQQPDAVVYVRREASDGSCEHPHLFDPESLRKAIEDDKAFDERFFPGRKSPSLASEILAYHEARHPHQTAHYVLSNRFADVS
ncbi:hypothetical protein LJR143_003522 [Pseudoxanthomonas sp. LjRoot143]|uniref:hypothetical protein n=1 Tax=Pseudoxanthomonas sp. LjRoot143 TaxID=3342266 RepID=UPI003ECEEE47